jgi:peroxiredoxin
VAISPQVNPYLRHSVEKNGVEFEMLSDPGNAVARQFGLVFQIPEELKQVYTAMKIDLPRYDGDDSWELPMTSRFVIDQPGVIRHAEFHPDYTIRPDPEETLDVLRGMAAHS